MRRSTELVKKALSFQSPEYLPRGEIWINSEVLKAAQLEDTLEDHLKLRNRLSMDLLFLPLSETEAHHSSQSYHYFNIEDVRKAVRISNLFVAVIIDGPFQRLVERGGLIAVLSAWKNLKEALIQEFQREAESIKKLIGECLGAGVRAFVLADDLAYDRSTYFSPKDAEAFLIPFYSELIEGIHAGDGYALFHSCGNISDLIPHLMSCGIDGLAACQSHCVDLVSLRREHPSELVLLGGIEPHHLESHAFSHSEQREFGNFARELGRGGGFILCSSTGLYKREFLNRIRLLYHLAEDPPGEVVEETLSL